MEPLLKKYLFTKHVLVNDAGEGENAAEVLYTLAVTFAIRVTDGAELAHPDMIRLAAKELGTKVPEPFYRGFPDTVRDLSPEQRIFDQFVHYTMTYGFGLTDREWHSMFETEEAIAAARPPFAEAGVRKDFRILTEKQAADELRTIAGNLLAGTRPLSDADFEALVAAIKAYDIPVTRCASKNTALKLLWATRRVEMADLLGLPDVLKLTEHIAWTEHDDEEPRRLIQVVTGKKRENTDLLQLNLRNRERKVITAVLDRIIEREAAAGRMTKATEECLERRALWSGLLHHLHWKPATPEGEAFADAMRGKEGRSVYSRMEEALAACEAGRAAQILFDGKGKTAVLRHLNHLLSRCTSVDDLHTILDLADSDNALVLYQQLLAYASYDHSGAARNFTFTRHNMVRTHHETDEERTRRRSLLSFSMTEMVRSRMDDRLREVLTGRLGRVYVSPAMDRMALPISESAAQNGFGRLARGSRVPVGATEDTKIRLFTYWEKVDDIDLSLLAITRDGGIVEYSWRSMWEKKQNTITFSGDQTAGFNGGSEYFDVNVAKYRAEHPDHRWLVCCDHVFSRIPFSKLVCRAGYMVRADDDTGQVFEPSTVATSFTVDCESTAAYLFAFDLDSCELIWLNTAGYSSQIVAGETDITFLTKWFGAADVAGLGDAFRMMATEVVDDPDAADVIVSDDPADARDGARVYHSWDFAAITALLEQRQR